MKLEFYSNYELALNKLVSFSEQGINDELSRAGLIQAFEFTYELAWKSIQKYASSEGLNVISPKQAFSSAMLWGWIAKTEEEIWIDIIKNRNLTTHTYKEALAINVSDKILNTYIEAFKKLLEHMKKT